MKTASCLALCLLLLCACRSDDPGQIDVLQVMANALQAGDLRAACSRNVAGKQSGLGCEGMLSVLLHYSPGFRGARVSRRGPSSGWRLSREVLVPVRYQGKQESGNLDVLMLRDGDGWHIVRIAPVP